MSVVAAIFDRDGVLAAMDSAALMRDVVGRLPLPPAEIARRWHAWNRRKPLVGSSNEQAAIRAFLRSIAEELGMDGAARERLEALDYAAHVRAFPDAEPALRAARERGIRIGVLTNNSAGLSAERILEIAGLAGLVDVMMSSQVIGAEKPDPRSYLAVASALGVAPESCLFFDNAPAWVRGAAAVGMRAYCVERSRAEHDLPNKIAKDLSAVAAILDLETRLALPSFVAFDSLHHGK